MKTIIKTVIALAVAGATLSAHAVVAGNASTDTTQAKRLVVAERDGKAGIQIAYDNAEAGSANEKPQALATMSERSNKWYSKLIGVSKTDNNGVSVNKLYNMPGWILGMPEHRDLGRLSFKQVGSQDVWYGDWEDVERNGDPSQGKNYSVFYTGSNPTAQAPTSGQATYTVQGINQYKDFDSAIMNGQLKADFDRKTLTGSISNQNLAVQVTAKVNEDATFNGIAVANPTTEKLRGASEGRFYGDNAEAVAGMATFGTNHQHNTAFGGTKN